MKAFPIPRSAIAQPRMRDRARRVELFLKEFDGHRGAVSALDKAENRLIVLRFEPQTHDDVGRQKRWRRLGAPFSSPLLMKKVEAGAQNHCGLHPILQPSRIIALKYCFENVGGGGLIFSIQP